MPPWEAWDQWNLIGSMVCRPWLEGLGRGFWDDVSAKGASPQVFQQRLARMPGRLFFFRIQEGSEFPCRNVGDREDGLAAMADKASVAKVGRLASRGRVVDMADEGAVIAVAAGVALRPQAPVPSAWIVMECDRQSLSQR